MNKMKRYVPILIMSIVIQIIVMCLCEIFKFNYEIGLYFRTIDSIVILMVLLIEMKLYKFFRVRENIITLMIMVIIQMLIVSLHVYMSANKYIVFGLSVIARILICLHILFIVVQIFRVSILMRKIKTNESFDVYPVSRKIKQIVFSCLLLCIGYSVFIFIAALKGSQIGMFILASYYLLMFSTMPDIIMINGLIFNIIIAQMLLYTETSSTINKVMQRLSKGLLILTLGGLIFIVCLVIGMFITQSLEISFLMLPLGLFMGAVLLVYIVIFMIGLILQIYSGIRTKIKSEEHAEEHV